MADYDAIVIGLGGAGSSAVYHLAASGARVLGLERFGPVHANGSSHGRSRIYRTAYFEGPEYVPLVRRAQELWFELQRRTGERIIRRTGGLMIGRPEVPTLAGARRTAEACRLEHEILDPGEASRRFPQFALAEDEVALFDPNAGVLFPETCVRCHASEAVGEGAELHYGEAVKDWSASFGSAIVRTQSAEYRARSLVITAGPWTAGMVPDLALPLEIERQFMLWFPPSEPGLVGPERMPVFLWDRGPEEHTYGVPDFGDGVKVGSWYGKVARSPEEADRAYSDGEALPLRRFVARALRGVVPRETEHASCLYTNAPDHHFLIGTHPRHANVVVVSACSGHGFKFTSALGEVIARIVLLRPTGHDLALFDPGRFDRTIGPR